MSQIKLDGSKLYNIAHASHSAEVTMTALALRERNRHFSDMGRTKTALIRAGEKIVDEEYRKFWHDLQRAGIGAIVHGRRGVPDRFEWYYALKMVADAALTGRDIIANRQAAQEEEIEEPAKKLAKPEKRARMVRSAASSKPKEKMVNIPLRKNFYLEVPADMTVEEWANVLANLQGRKKTA